MPACLLKSTTAAWAFGPSWAAAAPGTDVCNECRPCRRRRHVGAADVNVELALNRPTRNLDLILVVDTSFVDRTAAVRASVGERRFEGLVDVFGRRAMGLGAVVLAGFAAGLLRLGFGRPLGERSGLAFAGTALLVEKPREVFNLSPQLGDFTPEPETVRQAASPIPPPYQPNLASMRQFRLKRRTR